MNRALLREKWNQIPLAVKRFLLKGVIILVVWKVVYLAFLSPGRVLDAPLTHSVATITAKTLNVITGSKNYSAKSELGFDEDINQKAVLVQQVSIYFKHKK